MDATMGMVILTAIGMMGGFLAWYTNITVRDQFTNFRESLRAEMDKREEDLIMRVDKIEVYAHNNAHLMRNQIHQLLLKIATESSEVK